MAKGKFELTIVGDTPFRYRRFHPTFESAKEAASAVHHKMDYSGRPEIGYQRAAHPAIIYGPGCGRDGTTIA